MTLKRAVWCLALAAFGIGGLHGGIAQAQTTDGPGIAVSQTDITPGDRVVVTIGRFDSPEVTISVCGNNALRGSADCNMPDSEGVALRLDGVSTLAELPIAVPPVPCPCVLRVSTRNNEQVAYAPINLIGHPTAPLTPPEELKDPLELRVTAAPTPAGLMDRLRSSAGGAAMYELEVTVRNRSSATFTNVRVSGSAGRSPGEELVRIDFDDPGKLEPGQTWTGSATAELPALTLGEVEWRATASGAGSPTTGTATTDGTPWLLWTLAVVLVLDLGILLVRLVMRLVRKRRTSSDPQDNPFVNDPDGSGSGGLSVSDAEWPTADLSASETSAPETVRTPQLVP